MTPEQEHDIDNALLTLMYEWKIGSIDQRQALKEFKQCLKYYSRMEDVVRFEDNELVDEITIEALGKEGAIHRVKEIMIQRMMKEVISKGCVLFKEAEEWERMPIPARRFRMKMEAIIQTKQ